MSLYLTYDDGAYTDGIGAQVHRIVSVMAVAPLFGLPYLHTFVRRVNYQGHANQVEGTRDADYVAKWDRFLNLGHGLPTPESCGIEFVRERRKVRLRLRSAPWLACAAWRTNAWWKRHNAPSKLVRVRNAFPIVNRFPASYEPLREELRSRYALSPKPRTCYSRDALNVAIHIRRGDVTPESKWANRFVPNSTYVRLMLRMLAAAPGRHLHFHVFSEGNPAAPEAGFAEFAAIPNVTLHLDEDVFSTFHHLVEADVLVLGVSSFSFLAGLYHRGLTLNFPVLNPNPQLPSWLKLDLAGRFDAAKLRQRLPACTARRAA